LTRLFGTDGIRGHFGEFPLDRPTVNSLAVELAATLRERNEAVGVPEVVLGGDTRESTPEICRWLAEGLAAGGVRVRHAGVIPTPGIAFLAKPLGAAAGVVVSASHNPYPDNGIKLLDPSGSKWNDEEELALERRLLARLESGSEVPAFAEGIPVEEELDELYLRHLASTLPGETALDGLRVVLDAGNGAAFKYAKEIFERLGAQAELIHAEPNGRNVNEGCGSTAPEKMAAQVRASEADFGAAFDGDADRCILSDELGQVRDGDAILYLWATALHRRGQLVPPKIVATTMSNLGLERALAREGIEIVRCAVGDRYVVEAMKKEGIQLGGEQSGHVIQSRLASTGDGLLTAIQMAWLVHEAERSFSELLEGFRRYPQVLKDVRVARKPDLASIPTIAAVARSIEDRLGLEGRLVLRYSGTEPRARVMIEGTDQPAIEAMAAELIGVIQREIGTLTP